MDRIEIAAGRSERAVLALFCVFFIPEERVLVAYPVDKMPYPIPRRLGIEINVAGNAGLFARAPVRFPHLLLLQPPAALRLPSPDGRVSAISVHLRLPGPVRAYSFP